MKNFALLAKKCEGFTPKATIDYVKECLHPTHSEKVFAGMLKYALGKINENTGKNKCYLFRLPKKDWKEEVQAAFENADVIYKDDYGKDGKIRVYKFRGEEKFNYYFIKGEQLGEKFEILFLEEL